MGIIDDLKAKVKDLDQDSDGKINYEDIKAMADKHGMGDHLDSLKDDIVGPDGKLTADDAERAMNALRDRFGGLKDTFSSKKK